MDLQVQGHLIFRIQSLKGKKGMVVVTSGFSQN